MSTTTFKEKMLRDGNVRVPGGAYADPKRRVMCRKSAKPSKSSGSSTKGGSRGFDSGSSTTRGNRPSWTTNRIKDPKLYNKGYNKDWPEARIKDDDERKKFTDRVQYICKKLDVKRTVTIESVVMDMKKLDRYIESDYRTPRIDKTLRQLALKRMKKDFNVEASERLHWLVFKGYFEHNVPEPEDYTEPQRTYSSGWVQHEHPRFESRIPSLSYDELSVDGPDEALYQEATKRYDNVDQASTIFPDDSISVVGQRRRQQNVEPVRIEDKKIKPVGDSDIRSVRPTYGQQDSLFAGSSTVSDSSRKHIDPRSILASDQRMEHNAPRLSESRSGLSQKGQQVSREDKARPRNQRIESRWLEANCEGYDEQYEFSSSRSDIAAERQRPDQRVYSTERPDERGSHGEMESESMPWDQRPTKAHPSHYDPDTGEPIPQGMKQPRPQQRRQGYAPEDEDIRPEQAPRSQRSQQKHGRYEDGPRGNRSRQTNNPVGYPPQQRRQEYVSEDEDIRPEQTPGSQRNQQQQGRYEDSPRDKRSQQTQKNNPVGYPPQQTTRLHPDRHPDREQREGPAYPSDERQVPQQSGRTKIRRGAQREPEYSEDGQPQLPQQHTPAKSKKYIPSRSGNAVVDDTRDEYPDDRLYRDEASLPYEGHEPAHYDPSLPSRSPQGSNRVRRHANNSQASLPSKVSSSRSGGSVRDATFAASDAESGSSATSEQEEEEEEAEKYQAEQMYHDQHKGPRDQDFDQGSYYDQNEGEPQQGYLPHQWDSQQYDFNQEPDNFQDEGNTSPPQSPQQLQHHQQAPYAQQQGYTQQPQHLPQRVRPPHRQ